MRRISDCPTAELLFSPEDLRRRNHELLSRRSSKEMISLLPSLREYLSSSSNSRELCRGVLMQQQHRRFRALGRSYLRTLFFRLQAVLLPKEERALPSHRRQSQRCMQDKLEDVLESRSLLSEPAGTPARSVGEA